MYFLTSIHLKNETGFESKPDYSRCFGYFPEKQTALQAADENWADMEECLYDWLVIENIPEGLHAIPEEEVWYKWDIGLSAWLHAEKPEWSQGIINWSIG